MIFTVHLGNDASKLSRYISETLLSHIEKNLKTGKKILLYINRRGGYSSLVCENCSYLFQCPNCDSSLSVHLAPERLLCHLCGYETPIPLSCPHCHGNTLKHVGVGTQQIENALKKYFPQKSIFRFDTDNIKTKKDKTEALENLHNADIIIGTKMLTTGFDLEDVGCIGVILLEGELSYPQFNIEEKIYTSLRQLFGRGERKGGETDIIVQTFIPENPLVQHITDGNYKDFFMDTLKERKEFSYPPFEEMVTLDFRDANKEKSLLFMK